MKLPSLNNAFIAPHFNARRSLSVLLLIFTNLITFTSQAGDPEDPVTGLDWKPESSTGSGTWGWSNSWGSWGSGTPNPPYFNCNRPNETSANCGLGNAADPDTTPFLQEVINHNGRSYYHIIVGLPDQNFAQEIFIGTGGNSFSWGDSASGGETSCKCSWRDTAGMSGNGWDPLNSSNPRTGNETGNPTQVVMRQIVRSADMQQEFLKNRLEQKPIISQTTITPDAQMNFVVDMRNSDYATQSTPATMVNSILFSDPELPSFDINLNAPNANITAGRFTYLGSTGGGGGGWGGWGGWGGGGGSTPNYTYSDGGIEPSTVNWNQFYDPTQNNNRTAAGNIGKGLPSGGGGFPRF